MNESVKWSMFCNRLCPTSALCDKFCSPSRSSWNQASITWDNVPLPPLSFWPQGVLGTCRQFIHAETVPAGSKILIGSGKGQSVICRVKHLICKTRPQQWAQPKFSMAFQTGWSLRCWVYYAAGICWDLSEFQPKTHSFITNCSYTGPALSNNGKISLQLSEFKIQMLWSRARTSQVGTDRWIDLTLCAHTPTNKYKYNKYKYGYI